MLTTESGWYISPVLGDGNIHGLPGCFWCSATSRSTASCGMEILRMEFSVFGCCPLRSLVSLPCLCLLRFCSTNNYHRTGAKSTDFFGRSEYFSIAFASAENPYSLFTAAQFLRWSDSIFILDFFPVCFIMVLCKFVFALICKKSEKQPILAQKQPIFGLQKSR